MLLSLIIPFFNSEKKSKRLFKTLSNIVQNDIEIILIADGSTDNTCKVLSDFKKNSISANVVVIKQENKGPGGARNAGLRVAIGEYIWFIDSDDDIELDAIDIVRENRNKNYDFIDFNHTSKDFIINSMNLTPGSYIDSNKNRDILFNSFGLICTKIINKNFLIDNSIYYPEYCIYEDGPLMNFLYPLYSKRFLKTDILAYIHQVDYSSITRSKIGPHDFDRLYTSIYCYNIARSLNTEESVLQRIEEKFVRYYLFGTTSLLISILPSRKWLLTHRVMKQYRLVAKNLGINLDPISLIKNSSKKYQIYFLFHWYASFLLYKDQATFFEEQRLKAWNRPFDNNMQLK